MNPVTLIRAVTIKPSKCRHFSFWPVYSIVASNSNAFETAMKRIYDSAEQNIDSGRHIYSCSIAPSSQHMVPYIHSKNVSPVDSTTKIKYYVAMATPTISIVETMAE